MDIQRLVTQGDGSRSARPRPDLKGLRTDRIQRRQQKGFLLTPADADSLLLQPHAGASAALCPPRERKLPLAPDLAARSLNTGPEIRALPHGHHGLAVPAGPEQICGIRGGTATAVPLAQ